MIAYISKSQIATDLRKKIRKGQPEEVSYQLSAGDTAYDPESHERAKVYAPCTFVYGFSEHTGNIILISNE